MADLRDELDDSQPSQLPGWLREIARTASSGYGWPKEREILLAAAAQHEWLVEELEKAQGERDQLRTKLAQEITTLRAQAKNYGTPDPSRQYFPGDQARSVALTRHGIAEDLEGLLLPALSEAEVERASRYAIERGWVK